jgi:hypothetical protein
MRRAASIVLAVLLAIPAGPVSSAPQGGTISGIARMEGRPVSGVTVAFVDLQSGAVVRATSGSDGSFRVVAPIGEYAVTTESQAGLAVGQAPVRVAVTEGKVATADLDLVPVAAATLQEPPAGAPPAEPQAPPPPAPDAQTPPTGPVFAETTGSGAKIEYEPVTCFVAGEFPLLDASIQPIASVARARVYFKGAAGDSFFYIEMTEESGRFFGKLPRPRVEASPIKYYVQSTTTEFEESQTQELEAIVVNDKSECGDRKVAAFGPSGAVTVFSAATGASVIAPVGFAAAGAGLAVGVLSLIAAGAAAAGVLGGVVTGPGQIGPTPPPVVIEPSAIPTPAPIPTPTPILISPFN